MTSRLIASLLMLLAIIGCHKAAPSGNQTAVAATAARPTLECSATPTEWLPTTPEPNSIAAPVDPPDCFFYRLAWQHFLLATTLDAKGEPAFLTYPNIVSMFGKQVAAKNFVTLRPNALNVAVRDIQRPNDLPTNPSKLASVAEGIRQAGGLFGLVIDANGNPIYYSIHVNQHYADFIKLKGLTTRAAVEANPDLEFPSKVAEFKAAWAIVPKGTPIGPSYIHAQADIPNLVQDSNGVVRVGTGTHSETLELIAFHVAFVIDGHPEMIWATFEHARGAVGDLAPLAASKDETSAVAPETGMRYLLFANGAGRDTANAPCPGRGVSRCNPVTDHAVLDATNQNFPGQRTSVFREYAASKSDRGLPEDQSVVDLNASMRDNLAPIGKKPDVRVNYRLVGATWLEHPLDGDNRTGDFTTGAEFANAPDQDTENRSRMVAGEDTLSSMAMESFTQRDKPGCFACHNTRAVKSDETGRPIILAPTRLNVSHVISRFLSGAN